MEQYKRIVRELVSHMSVSGFERYDEKGLRRYLSGISDEVQTTATGSFVLWRRCGRSNAPVMLIDTHYDQIGLMVTGHRDGGFLCVTSVGGMDAQLLPASDVTVCGKKKLPGVVVSTPPHLRKPEDRDKLTPTDKLLIDTGLENDVQKELAPIGSPVVFAAPYRELMGNVIASPALDNKACAAAAIEALMNIKPEDMMYDVALSLSATEETGGNGALTAACGVKPDVIVCIDVNFASAPGVDPKDAIAMGKGPSVSLSALTSRTATKRVLSLAHENDIPCQKIVEIGNLGTNANELPLVLCGIKTVNMSLPLTSMHTPSETVSAFDGAALSRLLCVMMKEGI